MSGEEGNKEGRSSAFGIRFAARVFHLQPSTLPAVVLASGPERNQSKTDKNGIAENPNQGLRAALRLLDKRNSGGEGNDKPPTWSFGTSPRSGMVCNVSSRQLIF